MKYEASLITILWGSLLYSTLSALAQNSPQHQKDSLRQVIKHSEGIDKLKSYNRLCYLCIPEVGDDQKMDTLLGLFNQTKAEAIKQGNIEVQGMVYGDIIVSHINRKKYDEIIQKTSGYLDFYIRHELWKFYHQVDMQLIAVCSLKGNYKQTAEAAELMFDRARKQEDKAGMALTSYATGITYNTQNKWEEEEECFRECVGLLWEISGYGNVLTRPYAFLCTALRARVTQLSRINWLWKCERIKRSPW